MATYTLRVRAKFEAAHALRSYRGDPETIHGHSWQVEAEHQAETLDDEGMAFDFVDIKRELNRLAAGFDHRNINDVPPFDVDSPTTENLARWFFDQLRHQLPQSGLVAMTVWEGPDCSATYRSVIAAEAE